MSKENPNNFLSPFRIPFKSLSKPPPQLKQQQQQHSSPESQSKDSNATLESSSSVSNDSPELQVDGRRGKVFTGTGYSAFDWHRVDIQPPTTLRRITFDEIAQHASQEDCWIVLQGKVYDITKYIPFHPGGKYQILRGKGSDATELFMKTHPWVNPEPLLKKCWLGLATRQG